MVPPAALPSHTQGDCGGLAPGNGRPGRPSKNMHLSLNKLCHQVSVILVSISRPNIFLFLPVQPLIWTYANLWSNYSVADHKEITKVLTLQGAKRKKILKQFFIIKRDGGENGEKREGWGRCSG